MNIVYDVRIEPDAVPSGGMLTARLDYEAEPGAALLVGWSPGFRIAVSGGRTVTSQALQTPPARFVDLSIERLGDASACRITFTMRGHDGRTDGPPRSVRGEVG